MSGNSGNVIAGGFSSRPFGVLLIGILLIGILLLGGCASEGKFTRIDNRPFEPVALQTYSDGQGIVWKRIVDREVQEGEARKRLSGKIQELELLAERMVEPYFGVLRPSYGCLNPKEVSVSPTETSDELRKELDSVSNRDFVLIPCGDKDVAYRVRLTYLYCKRTHVYIESRMYVHEGENFQKVTCGDL